MRYIRKIPKARGLNEPILHGDHRRPVTRREMLSAGLITGAATVIVPDAWACWRRAPRAPTCGPTSTTSASPTAACTGGAGKVPFIAFDLSGGANLAGSNVLIGKQGGQLDFLTTAGYSQARPARQHDAQPAEPDRLQLRPGLPRRQRHPARHEAPRRRRIDRGRHQWRRSSRRVPENDTANNPHNPMYGIAKTGARGELLTLIGSVSSDSGGNSMAPAAMIDPRIRPTKVDRASDVTGLVDTGELGTLFADPADAVSVMESMAVLTHRKHGACQHRPGRTTPASRNSTSAAT